MVKVLTRMGLMMMDPETRRERLDGIMDGSHIHCDKVIEMVEACKEKCYELTSGESESFSEKEKIKIRWMLTRINAEEAVRNMNPDELAKWVRDLRENGPAFSSSDFAKVAKVLIRLE